MYIIGDIHGNARELENLINRLDNKKEKMVFLGDYINKGIATRETLSLLGQLKKEYDCIFIKGNHDYRWERFLKFHELDHQDFLLKYGVSSLVEFTDEPDKLILNGDFMTIKKYLSSYVSLIDEMEDYYLTDEYLIMHAGLTVEQLSRDLIVFEEKNYFLRIEDIKTGKKYLDKYVIIAGHTFLGEEPFVDRGYINIDLGAGYGKFLGALDTKNKTIVRSDGVIFNIKKYEYE